MFNEMLDATVFAEKKALVSDVEKFHVEKIPPQELKMGESEQGVENFVGDTIPAVIDKQSGIVSRKLQKAHDTFDIENAKVKKREQKIAGRFKKHAERTAQAFEDERATRLSKFMLLGARVGGGGLCCRASSCSPSLPRELASSDTPAISCATPCGGEPPAVAGRGGLWFLLLGVWRARWWAGGVLLWCRQARRSPTRSGPTTARRRRPCGSW